MLHWCKYRSFLREIVELGRLIFPRVNYNRTSFQYVSLSQDGKKHNVSHVSQRPWKFCSLYAMHESVMCFTSKYEGISLFTSDLQPRVLTRQKYLCVIHSVIQDIRPEGTLDRLVGFVLQHRQFRITHFNSLVLRNICLAKQVVQGSIQTWFENLKGWRVWCFSW